jgi:hypothetical protein
LRRSGSDNLDARRICSPEFVQIRGNPFGETEEGMVTDDKDPS